MTPRLNRVLRRLAPLLALAALGMASAQAFAYTVHSTTYTISTNQGHSCTVTTKLYSDPSLSPDPAEFRTDFGTTASCSSAAMLPNTGGEPDLYYTPYTYGAIVPCSQIGTCTQDSSWNTPGWWSGCNLSGSTCSSNHWEYQLFVNPNNNPTGVNYTVTSQWYIMAPNVGEDFVPNSNCSYGLLNNGHYTQYCTAQVSATYGGA
jgi:hypothetical protein